jgi:spore germination cell wall hydrolase CwlJ-like protein
MSAFVGFLAVAWLLAPTPPVSEIRALHLPNQSSTPYHEPVPSKTPMPVYAPRVEASMMDSQCLAMNIYFEARNQSIAGQIAVGLVTLTRVNHKRFGDTICEVVWTRKQFSWTHDGKSDAPKNKASYEMAQMVASILLDKDNSLSDITKGATHYHATYVDPYWAESLKRVATIEDHEFLAAR